MTLISIFFFKPRARTVSGLSVCPRPPPNLDPPRGRGVCLQKCHQAIQNTLEGALETDTHRGSPELGGSLGARGLGSNFSSAISRLCDPGFVTFSGPGLSRKVNTPGQNQASSKHSVIPSFIYLFPFWNFYSPWCPPQPDGECPWGALSSERHSTKPCKAPLKKRKRKKNNTFFGGLGGFPSGTGTEAHAAS